MQPFRTFLSRVRAWHIVAALAVTIVVALVSYLSGPPVDSIAEWLVLLIAPPILVFAVAFVAYAAFGRHDRAAALFPAVFLGVLTLAALPFREIVRRGADVSIGAVAVLCIALAIAVSAILVASRPALFRRRG